MTLTDKNATARSIDLQQRIDSTQPGLPTGPIGVVARGAPKTPPDNSTFWPEVNAVEFDQRGTGRREAYRAVAFYCSLTAERVCFASMASKAIRAGLSPPDHEIPASCAGDVWPYRGDQRSIWRSTRNPIPAHSPCSRLL